MPVQRADRIGKQILLVFKDPERKDAEQIIAVNFREDELSKYEKEADDYLIVCKFWKTLRFGSDEKGTSQRIICFTAEKLIKATYR